MSLQSCVDGEATGSRVHGGYVLYVLYVFQDLFLAVVPVSVVQMLGKMCSGYIGRMAHIHPHTHAMRMLTHKCKDTNGQM